MYDERIEAINRIRDKYTGTMNQIAYPIVGKSGFATGIVDEAINETLMQCYTSYDKLQQSPSEKGWVRRVFINKLLNAVRKQRTYNRHNGKLSETIADPSGSVSQFFENEENHELLESVLQDMSEDDVELLYEHFVDGKEYKELAEEKGTDTSVIKRLMAKALRRARKALRKHDHVLVFFAVYMPVLATIVRRVIQK